MAWRLCAVDVRSRTKTARKLITIHRNDSSLRPVFPLEEGATAGEEAAFDDDGLTSSVCVSGSALRFGERFVTAAAA